MVTMVLADGLLGQMMEPIEFDFEPIDPAKLPPKEYALGNRKEDLVEWSDHMI